MCAHNVPDSDSDSVSARDYEDYDYYYVIIIERLRSDNYCGNSNDLNNKVPQLYFCIKRNDNWLDNCFQ